MMIHVNACIPLEYVLRQFAVLWAMMTMQIASIKILHYDIINISILKASIACDSLLLVLLPNIRQAGVL